MISNLRSTADRAISLAANAATSIPAVNAWIAKAASRTSHKKARGSRCIDGFAVAVDAGQHVGVAHSTRLYQINATAQQLFQIGLGAEKCFQTGQSIRGEFHQKIGVAAGGVEVVCPRSRAKHLQPADAVALADGGYA